MKKCGPPLIVFSKNEAFVKNSDWLADEIKTFPVSGTE